MDASTSSISQNVVIPVPDSLKPAIVYNQLPNLQLALENGITLPASPTVIAEVMTCWSRLTNSKRPQGEESAAAQLLSQLFSSQPASIANHQLNQIQDTLTAVNKSLVSVCQDVANLKSDVEGLKSDVQELKSDVQELKSDVYELKSDVQELKSDVCELKSDVQVLKTDTAVMKVSMTSLEKFQKVQEILRRNNLHSAVELPLEPLEVDNETCLFTEFEREIWKSPLHMRRGNKAITDKWLNFYKIDLGADTPLVQKQRALWAYCGGLSSQI